MLTYPGFSFIFCAIQLENGQVQMYVLYVVSQARFYYLNLRGYVQYVFLTILS